MGEDKGQGLPGVKYGRTETTKHGVKLRINKPPLDDVRLAAFEGKLGRRLPDEYRDFLLRHNGGQPQPNGFVFTLASGKRSDSMVDWFLSLHDGRLSNLEETLWLLATRIPPETLPIADDPGGNCVLIGVSNDVRGKIYFWDHEREPEQQPDWSNVDLIANSFDEFMRCLTP